MASNNGVIPEAGVTNGDSTERDKRVTELLDDQDLRSLLIQRLEDGGHVVKKSTETNAEKPQGGPWQPFNLDLTSGLTGPPQIINYYIRTTSYIAIRFYILVNNHSPCKICHQTIAVELP